MTTYTNLIEAIKVTAKDLIEEMKSENIDSSDFMKMQKNLAKITKSTFESLGGEWDDSVETMRPNRKGKMIRVEYNYVREFSNTIAKELTGTNFTEVLAAERAA